MNLEFSVIEGRKPSSKRPREKYSRLICLGCRERRIRCELPAGVEIPDAGEQRTIETPCYRCRRQGVPCVVRQTVLGRPNPDKSSTPPAGSARPANDEVVSPAPSGASSGASERTYPTTSSEESQSAESSLVSYSRPRSPHNRPLAPNNLSSSEPTPLFLQTPRSPETTFICQALDTLRCECVEDEWFRHLPAYFGYTLALDLSIRALVTACAYSRGVPSFTAKDCYRYLSSALNAVQAHIKHSTSEGGDDILASTALLAPFEGVIRKNGIPMRWHVEGLTAILAARDSRLPASAIAKEILNFFVGETAVMACIQGTPSPFERVSKDYYANDRFGCIDGERTQLSATSNELFVRIPRLVMLVRASRAEEPRAEGPQQRTAVTEAAQLLTALLKLRNDSAEASVLRNAQMRPSMDGSSPRQSLYFASVKDFEALVYYWQCRLWLLRLEAQFFALHRPVLFQGPAPTPWTSEMARLASSLIMCIGYSLNLRLRKQNRLFAHAMAIVWGAVAELPSELDGESVGEVFNLLLERVRLTLEARPELTVEDMNVAANVFVGRQSRGRFAEVFGS